MQNQDETKEDFGGVYSERSRTAQDKLSRAELVNELVELRQRIIELEASESRRKRAEEALRQSEEELRAIFDGARDGIVVLDTMGRVVRVNKYILEIGGYTEDELVGKRIDALEMFPPQSMAKILSAFRELGTGRDMPPYEIEVYLKTGEKRIGEVHSSLVRQRGRVVGIVGIMRDITERKRAEEELRESLEKLRSAMEGTVEALISTTERRDPYTAGHQQRVTQLAWAIAREMDLTEEQIEGIRVAGSVHDIGKIYVPAEILSKPGRITDIEFSLIKIHPQVGQEILRAVNFPWPVADIVLQHQERWDGSGYPAGLKGDEILLEARILAVADVVEAMASHRPYRSARGIDEALEEISRNRGILYDAEVVGACLKLFTEKGFTFE
jgi:PAS domain S-box-containing protein/putative nucleotidyltransferase with HDIG domain